MRWVCLGPCSFGQQGQSMGHSFFFFFFFVFFFCFFFFFLCFFFFFFFFFLRVHIHKSQTVTQWAEEVEVGFFGDGC